MPVSDHQPYALNEHDVQNRLSRPLTLSVGELWMLNDVVRHEMAQQGEWKFPPVSRELNEEIALALHACLTDKLSEYTLLVTEGDLLLIDYVIRRDMKTPEGARGEDILKKVFKARAELAFQGLLGAEIDESHQQALERVAVHYAPGDEHCEEQDDATTGDSANNDASTDANAGPNDESSAGT